MRRTLQLLIACAVLFSSALAFGQMEEVKSVTGTVKDETGLPLPGVIVNEKGTNNSTATNQSGSFTIKIKPNATLVFRFMGFIQREIIVDQTNSFNVVLKEDIKQLEDVVVVGYGTQKKTNLTGAVSVIKGTELTNRPTPTLSQALQGKVAGVNFGAGNFGFEPGAALSMQIRGQGTPLILVDGIVTTNVNGINPNDIESVSVLKDAAASAIYGAKAPYGVVLITTKSGSKDGKLSIEYSGNYSAIKPINMPHQLDSYTNALALNEAAKNSGVAPVISNTVMDRILAYQLDPINTPETVPSSGNAALWATVQESNANYDWFDVFYGNGQRYQHNLSLSGGNNGLNFYISGALVNDGGVLQVGTDNYKRYNFNAKFDANLTKWMKLTSNTRYFNSSRNTPAYDNQGNYDLLFHQVARTFPNQYMKSPNGVYSAQSKIPWTKDAGVENTSINDVIQRFAAEITPVKGLTINGDYTLDIISNQFSSKNFTTYEDNVAGAPVLIGSTNPSSISRASALTFYQTLNAFSTYKFDIADTHRFTLMAGYQQEKQNLTSLSGSKNSLITSEVPTLNTAVGVQTANDNLSAYATEGVFGRFGYNFKERYLFEFNGRYDGTYKFAKGKKWGFFPSVAAGWNIANEKFWQSLSPVVNTFKLRASYGSLGNQGDMTTVAAYQDLPIVSVGTNLGWILNGARPNFANAPTLVNPNITWETSNTKNLGIDLEFLNNRLWLTGEVYQRLTFDKLGPSEALPAVLGAVVPQSNNQEVTTNGWELSLGWNDKVGDFKYSVSGQLFDYKNTVTKYNNPTLVFGNPYTGQKGGEIWGFTSKGLILDQATADAINSGNIQKAISGQVWKVGDMQYMDLDGDGVVTRASAYDKPGDMRIIGNSTPRYQFGFNLRMEWKGFDISTFVQGVGKRDLVLGDNFFWGFVTFNQSSLFKDHLNYYRDADATKYAGLGINRDAYFARPYLDGAMNAKNQQVQTRYMQNAAYARLKNLQLGYSLPASLVGKAKLQSVYLFASGENLMTISNLPSHFDPENANLGARGPGKSFFPQAAYTFGANLKF